MGKFQKENKKIKEEIPSEKVGKIEKSIYEISTKKVVGEKKK